MKIVMILIIALVLATDGFTVAVSKGDALREVNYKKMLYIGAMFGIIQIPFMILGGVLGNVFKLPVFEFTAYTAVLFTIVRAIPEIIMALRSPDVRVNDSMNFFLLLGLGAVSSLDAFVLGMLLVAVEMSYIPAAIVSGVVTFVAAAFGLYYGNKKGIAANRMIGIIGAALYIVVGVMILLMSKFSFV